VSARARYRKVEIAHYRSVVHVIIGPDLPRACAAARRRCPALTDARAAADDAGLTLIGPDGSPWVCLPADASPGLVGHETVHAAVAVAQRVGLPVSAEADEVLAYLVGDIVDAIVYILTSLRQKTR
jgi:hypothetical protein